MAIVKISALVVRERSEFDPEKPDAQTIALLLESGVLRDKNPEVIATPAAVGFQTLIALLTGTDESAPVRVLVEAKVPGHRALSRCAPDDLAVVAIFI